MVQLLDTTVNVNHAVSITGNCIYDSTYRRELPFMKEYVDIICSLSKDDKYMYAYFEDAPLQLGMKT